MVPAVVAFGSFALGTYGFWEMLPPPRSLFETLPDAAWWALQMFFMNFEDPREAGGPVGPALQAARFGAFVTTVRVILQAFFPQAWQTVRRWCRPSWRARAIARQLTADQAPWPDFLRQELAKAEGRK